MNLEKDEMPVSVKPASPGGGEARHRDPGLWGWIGLGVVLVGLGVLLYVVSRVNYPLFHSIVDMATVFIAGSVFLVVWKGRRHLDNDYYLFIAVAFLAFALLDFVHLIGNKDMGVFPGYGNLGPTFYIASRYVLGVSFLLAPLFIKRKLSTIPVLALYLVVVVLVLLSVLSWRNFPATYIEGTGLTAFKIYSDYAVCLMLLGGLGLLLLNRRAFDPRVLKIIALSLVLSIATGLAFTLYSDAFGVMNAVGHFLQIASFYLIYLGFVETVLTKPQNILYRNLKQSEEALRESEVRLRLFIEHAPASLAMFDRQMRYLSVSRRWLSDYGLVGRDIIGQSHYDVFPEISERWREFHRRGLAGKVVRMEEDPFQRADGSTQWLRWEIWPWHDADGGVAGMVIVTEDITERKAAVEKLRAANEGLAATGNELARSNKELEQFGYIVSHDLQEPLRGVMGFLQLLQSRFGAELSPKAQEYVAFAVDGSQRMSQLIRDLLEYSRVQSKAKELAPTDMKAAFAQATANCRASVEESQAIVTCDDLPIVRGDRTLLTQLLQNLIGNAIKFRRDGVRPEVHVGVQSKDEQWVFQVRDNGIGVPADQAGRLFQLFQRLHGRDRYPGTGIGLAIGKKIVERHGGRIWIESKVGEGSKFCFTLPTVVNRQEGSQPLSIQEQKARTGQFASRDRHGRREDDAKSPDGEG